MMHRARASRSLFARWFDASVALVARLAVLLPASPVRRWASPAGLVLALVVGGALPALGCGGAGE